jgi:hypothetical protein
LRSWFDANACPAACFSPLAKGRESQEIVRNPVGRTGLPDIWTAKAASSGLLNGLTKAIVKKVWA